MHIRRGVGSVHVDAWARRKMGVGFSGSLHVDAWGRRKVGLEFYEIRDASSKRGPLRFPSKNSVLCELGGS